MSLYYRHIKYVKKEVVRMKRMTIRFVDALADRLSDTAKERGISINAMVTEMAWQFVDDWVKLKEYVKSQDEKGKSA